MTMTEKDKREFQQYLKNCTDAQVQGVYDKESKAGRTEYADLAFNEAMRRAVSWTQ